MDVWRGRVTSGEGEWLLERERRYWKKVLLEDRETAGERQWLMERESGS